MGTSIARGLVILAAAELLSGCFAEPEIVEPIDGGTSGEGTSSDDDGGASEDATTEGSATEGATTEDSADTTSSDPPRPEVLFSFYDESCEGTWEAALGGGSLGDAPCDLEQNEPSLMGGVRLIPEFESEEFGSTMNVVVLEPGAAPNSLLQGAFVLDPAYFADGPPTLQFSYEVFGDDPGFVFQITTPGTEETETLFDTDGVASTNVEIGLEGLSGEEISFVAISGGGATSGLVALYDARILAEAP